MAEKKWRTAVTQHIEHETYVRGYRLLDLVGNLSFAQAIYLILKGELPNEAESRMMEAIFVSVIDHGIAPPSVIAARAVASGGNSLNVGVAAGVMAFGSAHGGALEDAMRFIQEGVLSNRPVEDIVGDYLSQKKPIPGFGHRYYKEFDPRTKRLMELARLYGFYGKHCEFAQRVEEEILVPGLVAHVYEELVTEKPFSKRLSAEETQYTGVPPRDLPEGYRKV